MFNKNTFYFVATLSFLAFATLFYSSTPMKDVSPWFYFPILAIFVIGVAMMLIALNYMQKYHHKLKYKTFVVQDNDGVINIIGKTRFLPQEESIFTIDLNKVSALTLDFELFEPESLKMAFWDQDPKLELSYFGLTQNNSAAKTVKTFPIPIVHENPKLGEAFKEALSPYVSSGKLFNEFDMDVWKRDENAPADNVRLLDTGFIEYIPNQRE